jgi:hypothetical protein
MKKTKLTSNKGFKVSVPVQEKTGVVCSARSQCRTTHKRKDC